MNPSCSACDSQATRVCIHPSCQFVPFLCSNKCKNNVAEKIHTHSDQLRLIPYSKLDTYLSQLEDTNNEESLNEIRKKIARIQDNLYTLLEEIEGELTVNVMRLSKNSISMIDVILSKNHEDLTGKDIHHLLLGKNIYEDQEKKERSIDRLKRKYHRRLDLVEEALSGVQQVFKPEEKKILLKQAPPIVVKKQEQSPEEKFLQYFGKGLAEFKKGEHLNALRQFLVAQTFNPYEPSQCLNQLGVEDQINQYKKSIQLGASESNLIICYLLLSKAYTFQKKHEEAMGMIDKAVEIDKGYESLYFRGTVNLRSKEYVNALVDFSEAIERAPKNKELYEKRAECYGQLGMALEALQDCITAAKL